MPDFIGTTPQMVSGPPKRSALIRLPGIVALAAISSVSFGVMAFGVDRSGGNSSTTTTYTDVSELQVETSRGDITIVRGEGNSVQVRTTESWSTRKPKTTARLKDGKLALVGSCSHLAWITVNFRRGCEVTYVVTVPANTDVDVTIGAGESEVSGLAGKLRIEVGAGAATVSRGRHRDAQIEVSAGEIDAEFLTAPTRVEVASGVGDTTVVVPSGSYDIEVNVGAGDSSVDSRVVADRLSPRKLTIDAGAGDVTVNAGPAEAVGGQS